MEQKLKNHIAKWRAFKRAVNKQKYEQSIPENRLELFTHSPCYYLDRIHDTKIKLKYCELKISYYREIETVGATIKNHKLRKNIERKMDDMLENHYNLLIDM